VSIEWRVPPDTAFRSKRSFSAGASAELRQNPGEWAVISKHRSYSSGKGKTYIVQHGKTPSWTPAGAFEAVMDPATFEVYARYVGDQA
jgi:hypothetical protein